MIERSLFASRWMLAPMYLGLVVAVAMLVWVFGVELWGFILGVGTMTVDDAILGVLALIDLSLAANLLMIVIFDRLRESLAKYKTTPLRDLMNLSANETLSRTLMTAVTTLIALVVLLVFGGDMIRGFVFAMLFGVIVGTWSTLYLAKNIVLFLGLDRSDKAKRKLDHEFAHIEA